MTASVATPQHSSCVAPSCPGHLNTLPDTPTHAGKPKYRSASRYS
jgi:hypothetical protein